MLQAIRSKASSLAAKLLFGVLVISFGIWGIGDIFRNRGVDTSTVATVGGRKISAQELGQAVNEQAEQLRGLLRGVKPDAEQLKQLGIIDGALQQLVNGDLADLEIARLRLAVSDSALHQAILANPAFKNDAGQFDPERYKAVVSAQHMSVSQFEATLRRDLLRFQLDHAVVAGVTPPPELVDMLFRGRAERRIAEIVTIPPNAVTPPAAPSDTELSAFYDQHKDALFRVPELRSFHVGLLLVDNVAQGIAVPQDKLHDEYQSRIAEFHTPEQRHLDQILLPDEAKAKEAEAQLATGKDFTQVAKDLAGATPDMVDLGFLARDEMPGKLADAAFALKSGETTKPIQDEIGWHILRVGEIKPEVTQPLDAVKDKLTADIQRDMAGDEIAKVANQIDDALAGGASFADVAQRFGLKVSEVTDVDASGNAANGATVEMPQPQSGPDILRAAFATDAGQTSQLNELGDSGYYLVMVDKVTPSANKPLDEVRARAVGLWQEEKRNAALEQLAKDMADAVNSGHSLSEVVAPRKLAITTTAPLQRSGGDAQVPPAVVAKIFEAAPGKAVFAQGNDGYVVAVLKEVQPPDPAKEGDAVARLSQQLAPTMKEDLLQEFDRALRDRFPVHIDDQALARAF
jgi:peptidyl-prolyl cis-trans isomerase D